MAEEISNFVSNLRIDDEEDQIIDFDTINPNAGSSVSLLLLGRLLTERSFNVDAFKRTTTTVWAPSNGLVIRVLSPNLFAFQFFHWRDMRKVLDGRPWCFDNMLVLLKEADGDEPPDQVILNQSPFWIRLKNLPFNMRSDDVIKLLIGNMGDIIEIEEDVLGFGRYRRVKVMLDISKPLRRYRKLRDKKGNDIQVDFAYERLPFFCLACGVMGHSEKDCHSVPEEDRCEKLGWHLGLKATPRKGRSKEIEEENKYRNCKKVLFDASSMVRSEKAVGILSPALTKNAEAQVDCMAPKSQEAACLNGKHAFNAPLNILSISSKPIMSGLQKTVSHSDHFEVAPPITPALMLPRVKAAPLLSNPTPNVEPPVEHLQLTDPTTEEHYLGPPGFNAVDFATINKENELFVFGNVKDGASGNARGWKRLARRGMDEKGEVEEMDMDPMFRDVKRSMEFTEYGVAESDGTTKRVKLSPSNNVATFSSVEVGEDQPHPAL